MIDIQKDKENLNHINYEDKELSVFLYLKTYCLEKFLANIKRDYAEKQKVVFISHSLWKDSDNIDENLKRLSNYLKSSWIEVNLDYIKKPENLETFMKNWVFHCGKVILVWTLQLAKRINKDLESSWENKYNITKEYSYIKEKISKTGEESLVPILFEWTRRSSFPKDFIENFSHLLVQKFTDEKGSFDVNKNFDKIPEIVKNIFEIKNCEKYDKYFEEYKIELSKISKIDKIDIESLFKVLFEGVFDKEDKINLEIIINIVTLKFILGQSKLSKQYNHINDVKYFSWRIKEIIKLNNKIFPNIGNKTFVQILSSWPWEWKTALSKQFIANNQNEYSFNFLINCSDSSQMKISYEKLCENLKIPTYKKSLEELKKDVKNHLSKKDNYWWILLFDNVIKQEDIIDCIPPIWWSVIITTQNSDWYETDFEVENLEKLDKDSSFELFLKVSWKSKETLKKEEIIYIEKLTKRLWFLPLAIKNSASYIRKSKKDIGEYLDLLSRWFPNIIKLESRLSDYEKTVYESLILSIESIENPFLKEMLYIISFLDETKLPVDFISKIEEIYPRTMKNKIERELEFDSYLSYLYEYCILEEEEKTKNKHIHRLQSEVINIASAWDKRYYIDLLTNYMKKYSDYDSESQDKNNNIGDLVSHILKLSSFVFDEFIINGYKKIENVDDNTKEKIKKLLLETWIYLSTVKSNFLKAEFIFSNLIINNNNMNNDITLEQANLYNKSWYNLLIAWNYKEALKEYKKSKKILDYLLSTNTTQKQELQKLVADNYSWIWSSMRFLFKHEESLEFHKKSLEIRIKLYWEYSLKASLNYRNIWILYFDMWKYDESIQYHEKSVKIREKLWNSLETWVWYSSLWKSMAKNWKTEEWIEFLKKWLQLLYKKFWNKDNIRTTILYNDLWVAYFDKWDYNLAEENLLKSFDLRVELLWDSHPYTLETFDNISSLYNKTWEQEKLKEIKKKLDSFKKD